MTCRFCGTALPEGALFCGECGRTVVASEEAAGRPVPPEVVFSSEPDADPEHRPMPVADSEYTCPQCDAPISDDDVFCGECGFVLTSSYLSAPSDAVGDPRDTTELDPLVDDLPRREPGAGGAADSEPEPAEPEPPADEPPADEPRAAEPPPAPRTLRSVPDPFPWGQNSRLATADPDVGRISGAEPAEERFVLQFSTGESVTVAGAGLIGRNPASQPGEYVDQLVTVFDAGKSVSKTHLEFGQEGGRFWVSDRHSTNGSTVRQPDADPKRCEPGRRYFVTRGTRVDIGEQFFVVS